MLIAAPDRALPALAFDEAKRAFAPLADEPALLLAVSGGADSTALLVSAARWTAGDPARRPRLHAATVDHGWRPDSRQEAEAVAELCKQLDVPHAILTVPDWAAGRIREEAARDARYAVLREMARELRAVLVTAHTIDDQAETVLMRLGAGSGPAGLAAMRPESVCEGVRHARPFLSLPKTAFIAYLEAADIPFFEDPSNLDPRFARARLRKARAVLEREGLTAERLGTLARRMARLDDAVECAVDRAYASLCSVEAERIVLAGPAFLELEPEIALRILGRAIRASGTRAPRLAPLERLFEELCGTLAARIPLARTLADAKIESDGAIIVVARAPPRRVPRG